MNRKLWAALFCILIYPAAAQNFGDLQQEAPVDETSEQIGEQPREIEYPVLRAGETVNGIIDTRDGRPYVTYRFFVPEQTGRVVLRIEEAPVDLDIYVKHSEEILDYSEVDYASASDDFNEVSIIDHFSSPPLQEGEYYIDIAYQWEETPSVENYPEGIIPFSLTYEEYEPSVRASLEAGTPFSDSFGGEDGMHALYSIEVPRRTEALRFDLFETGSDLDLLVAYENPNVSIYNYDEKAESLAGREHMVIKPDSGRYLRTGTYYVMVFDQVSMEGPVSFSILPSFSENAPAVLLGIPGIPVYENPLEYCLSATVEISGPSGRGSGVLVSDDGYILTNWHVVRDDKGLAGSRVSVAVSRDFYDPPEELFLARIVRYNEEYDLALLKIESGFYSQPIPEAYLFPYFELGTDHRARIGQPISIIGYPDVGGSGSRVSVTLTKGIISGLMRYYDGFLYKTDAEMNPGNSGGAVVNAFYELIGLPTTIVGDASGKMGFIHPISLLPPSWLMLISGH